MEWPRADAHIHLFSRAETSVPGTVQDDAVRYAAHATDHGVTSAVVVCPPQQVLIPSSLTAPCAASPALRLTLVAHTV